MTKVCIVTDSTAHFSDPAFPQRHSVEVVPLTISFGARRFTEGVDLDTPGFFQRLAAGGPLPVANSPTPEQFAAVYERVARTTDQIISIHLSGKLSRATHNARLGSESLMGRCKIQVIDSLSTSVGLGLLVQSAALAAERGEGPDEIVRIVRGMIPRLYTVFFTESLEFLANAGRLGKAQAVLGSMLSIKPFLALEDGDIVPMEKVKTRQQAVEKLVEFVVEFSNIEHLTVLQSTPEHTEDTQLFFERLSLEFPGRHWPVLPYGPSLATFLGPGAMGVVVFEGEEEIE